MLSQLEELLESRVRTLDELWNQLEPELRNLFQSAQLSRNKYLELFTLVYNYCSPSQLALHQRIEREGENAFTCELDCYFIGMELYKRINNFLKDYLHQSLKEALALMDEHLFAYYILLWDKYKTSSKAVHGICSYLSKFCLKHEKDEGENVPEINQCANLLWRDELFLPLQNHLIKAILQSIKRGRRDEPINDKLLSNMLLCYHEMDVLDRQSDNVTKLYDTFEAALLKDTRLFYTKRSAIFIKRLTISEYMKKVHSYLRDEEDRCRYLSVRSKDLVTDLCINILISDHFEAISEKFEILLDNDKLKDLKRMVHLVSLTCSKDNVLALAKRFESYVCSQGLLAVEKCAKEISKDATLYVTTILEVKKTYKRIIKAVFCAERTTFETHLDMACKKFFNQNAVAQKRSYKPAELFASYFNVLLHKRTKISENALRKSLHRAIHGFKFLDDKDVFMKTYKKFLAERLALKSSTNEEAEEMIISKLQACCGCSYVQALKDLLRQNSINRDMMTKFSSFLSFQTSSEPLGLNFSAYVLQSSCGILQLCTVSLPVELERCINRFATFYNIEHNGRKLTWLYNMSKGELLATCFKKQYTLQASTIQIAVLLHFNTSDSYTLQELQESIKMNFDVTSQIIQSLLKCRLVIAECDEKDLKPSTIVKLNQNYENKKVRVNINRPIKFKSNQEAADSQVAENRKHSVEAAIVRIMKTRKEIEHQQLIIEVIEQLKANFKPQVPYIRKCIDRLMEREYMKRSEENINVYEYIA